MNAKTTFFDKEISENERKTIVSLLEIKNGKLKLIKKNLCQIYRETNIYNEKIRERHTYKRPNKKEETSKGYQHGILKQLINKGILEKDETKKYKIKQKYIDLARSSLIQNKINDLEKKGQFSFLDSTVFGIENNWLKYAEMHYFHESLVNGLSSLYILKMIKKIFLLRDFSVKWNYFLDSDIPLGVKYVAWKTIRSKLDFFNGEKKDEFLEKQVDILKSMKLNKKEIDKFMKAIKEQHKNFIIELRKKIGYKPYKKDKRKNDRKELSLDDNFLKEYIDKNLNKKQKEEFDYIKNWCLTTYPEEINNTGFFLDLGNLRNPEIHFNIHIDNEEKLFRRVHNELDFSKLKPIFKEIKKENIDDKLKDILDVYYFRNDSRFVNRFQLLFISQIQKPFYKTFYKQMDKKTKKEIFKIIRTNYPRYNNKNNFEVFYNYAVSSTL